MTILVDSNPERTGAAVSRQFYFAAWRWHFYAGLYVAPFLVMLALTGLVMLWVAVIDGRDGEKAFTVQPSAVETGVSAQAEAAQAAVPGGALKQYIAPRSAEGAAVFRVDVGDAAHMVAVDPYRAEVLGQWPRQAGWYDLANDIHGSLLIGTVGDRLIEIAAGFGIILTVTGLYLWWPRNGKGLGDMLVPNIFARGRLFWKSMHQTIGFYMSLLLIVFLVSGLSWTGIWGEKFVQAWSTFPAAKWDNVPLSDETHASMNHGAAKEVPWGLEQTPMPASGSHAGHHGVAQGTAVDFASVVAFARSIGFDQRFQVNFPAGDKGVWTLSRDSMSNDSSDPTTDRTVHIDRFTGNTLADVGFGDYSAGAKAMAVGVAFHEGDLGAWNTALVTLFCLSVIFLSVSGAVMWWMRRPRGVLRLAPPPLPEAMPLWKGAVLLMLALSMLFPLTGLTLVAVLAVDVLLVSRLPALKRALN